MYGTSHSPSLFLTLNRLMGWRCNLGSITSNLLCPDAYLPLCHSVRVIKLPADRTSNRSIGPAITAAVGGPPTPRNTTTPAQTRVEKKNINNAYICIKRVYVYTAAN